MKLHVGGKETFESNSCKARLKEFRHLIYFTLTDTFSAYEIFNACEARKAEDISGSRYNAALSCRFPEMENSGKVYAE